MYETEIVYDRPSGDYAMYVNSELIGYARNYSEAQTTLDTLVDALTTSTITTMPGWLLEAQAAFDRTAATNPPGFPEDDDDSPDGGGPPRAPSLYAFLVAECQAELDARLAPPVVMVMDLDYAPVSW